MVVRFLVCLALLSTLSLSGCGVNVTPLAKYDKKSKDLSNVAVAVIGTKNVTFLDITKYTDPRSLKARDNAIKQLPTAKAVKPTHQESAMPNTDYKDNRYNLRRLFANNNPPQEEVASANNVVSSSDQVRSPERKIDDPQDLVVDHEYRIHKPSTFFNLFSYAKCTYILKPGIYYISFAFYDPNMDVNPNQNTEFTRLPGVSRNGVVQYGAFKVQAGDVVYVGDIALNWVDQNSKEFVAIDGDIANVKTDLIAAGEDTIAKRIQQAKFYRRGAKIALDRDSNEFYLE